ncbi:hypothetical protein ATO6_10180 [Oceanicola sp. 22II-s10i]|nr:hypothetical protein ATO6_10180 [Oceanicola sp. 22II-s10i]
MVGAVLIWAAPASAHEFWLEAEDWTVEPGGTIRLDMRNGVEMKGPTFPWDARRVARADLVAPSGTTPYEGRIGDMPAVRIEDAQSGLNVMIFESKVTSLTYDRFELFRKFTEEKALDDALRTHLDERLPQNGLREIYTRHTKALIAVGDGAGEDADRGLDHELVALTNPYTLAPGEPMRVRLLRDGAPVPDVRITVFRRDDADEVTVAPYQTDGEGRIAFPLEAGSDYLVDNVYLRRTTRQELLEHTAIWASSWAALTFGVDG